MAFNQLGQGKWLRPASTSRIDKIPVDERYKLMDVLARKLYHVPAGMIKLPRKRPQDVQNKVSPANPSTANKRDAEDDSKFLKVTEVVDHHRDAIDLPHIPTDVGLDFLLKHHAIIDEQGCLAIKDPAVQHIDITRAIFFWRLDDIHQFQRYHDNARWNIALFVASLADERSAQPEPAQMHSARQFAIAYLSAVLEHHRNPASFEMREAFVKLWKYSKYDFFTFTAAQKMLMKKEMKRLKGLWKVELDRLNNGKDLNKNKKEVEAAYNAKIAKFVGILVPGGARPAWPQLPCSERRH
ncbi:hypothetical protein BU23DRAFT_315729 [Bimuria novae-zelandiae CBS 107.79]|uniref:Uncharacterized protein n=1 Tax=Bimuria novae-zelandiae CBS 107.79 TaxID=1447943 RepID=A0A6A5URE2_9PLEO|nr:hypothetical protein BU23DRAFT_315729 [Bimuria novae-zelandiae CBS 107.79]